MPQPPKAPSSKGSENHCYPGSEPGISCDGIAAKAAVDQARDADKQAAPVWWQFGVGIATLAAAVAAAIFAWQAAHHTKRSADIAEGTARRQLRAYLGVEDVRLIDYAPGKVTVAHIIIKNTGQTPARDVRFANSVKRGDVDSPSKTPIRFSADDRDDIENSKAQIAPQQTITIRKRHEGHTNRAVLANVMAEKVVLVAAGIVEYRDIFGRRHLLTYKYKIDSAPDKDGIFHAAPCGKGNNAS